jgi:ribonuclease P protein component
MPDSPRRLRFQQDQRLRSRTDFERVYDGGQRAGDNVLLVFALPNALGKTRIGLSVSRKHGNAVRRAQLKRRMREAFRLLQHELPAQLDLILIPRQGGPDTLAAFQDSLGRLTRKLARRLEPPTGSGG